MQLTHDLYLQDIHIAIERCIMPVALDLHEFGLLDKSFSNKDVFDILTHHVLKDICEEIICGIQNGSKSVLYINTKFDLSKSEYILNTRDRKRAVERLEKLIPRVIPGHVVKRPYNVHRFAFEYEKRSASAYSEIENIRQKMFKNAFKSFNLNKIIKYLDQRGLKYLSTEYFQQENKKLLAANK
jgi:hypothetical protein